MMTIVHKHMNKSSATSEEALPKPLDCSKRLSYTQQMSMNPQEQVTSINKKPKHQSNIPADILLAPTMPVFCLDEVHASEARLLVSLKLRVALLEQSELNKTTPFGPNSRRTTQ